MISRDCLKRIFFVISWVYLSLLFVHCDAKRPSSPSSTSANDNGASSQQTDDRNNPAGDSDVEVGVGTSDGAGVSEHEVSSDTASVVSDANNSGEEVDDATSKPTAHQDDDDDVTVDGTNKDRPTKPSDKGQDSVDYDGDTANDGTDADSEIVLPQELRPCEKDDDIVCPVFCETGCSDFPAAPLLYGVSPENVSAVSALFGDPDNFVGPGPCVIEPQLSTDTLPGTLFPANWLRPRFRFEPADDADLFEIRFQAQGQLEDLVVYTDNTTWVMGEAEWRSISERVVDTPITVTIRGVNSARPGIPTGTRGTFTVAPVTAPGKLIYWATTSSNVRPDTSWLAGFAVGEEQSVTVLTIEEVGTRGILSEGGRELRGAYQSNPDVDPYFEELPPGGARCIGCHAGTPDGEAVGFTDHWPWNNVLAAVEDDSKEGTQTVGERPDYQTDTSARLLNQPWLGMMAFSSGHWQDGDRVAITTMANRDELENGVGFIDAWGKNPDRIAWFDLEASGEIRTPDNELGITVDQMNADILSLYGSAFGRLEMAGETRSATAPAWSNDGSVIAYVSATVTLDGRIGANNEEVDIHMVPYNNRRGGSVSPLEGAAEPGVAEYYPSFSADDKFVAFNRVDDFISGKEYETPHDGTVVIGPRSDVYYRPDGEVYIVLASGGYPVRLMANDPPVCTGEQSPGVINSWPKWSPKVTSVSSEDFSANRSYYWLVFSSGRDYAGRGDFKIETNRYSAPDTRPSQLYLTAVVVDEDTGEVTTYPALYLWNQDPQATNLTPAWDYFKIPSVSQP